MKELVIDISHWDGDIDLNAWKQKRNLWGVIIKAGGNETNLGRYQDSQFENNYQKAVNAGLHIGAYYYTVSTDNGNAKKDAEHFANLLSGHNFDLPCYMDVEDNRQFALSARALTDVITTFCLTLGQKGYYPGLYTGGSAWLNNMYADELRQFAPWIAWWKATWPTAAGEIGMWQQGGMRLSDGHIVYDDVGGYQDLDWCVVDYPSIIKGGNMPNSQTKKQKISLAEIAAQIHYDMVTDEANGYSQAPQRWGGDSPLGSKTLTIFGKKYTYKRGSYDCSSSVITAWRLTLQGTPFEGALDSATYTGDMKRVFVNSGLFYAEYSPAKRGDIYLAEEKHTAMCQDGGNDGVFGYDALSEFNRNENRGATNGRPGDQDGYESVVRAYYDDGWNTILHYNGKGDYYLEEEVEEFTKEESEMGVCFVKFDGDGTEHFWDGQHLHAIANADEKTAIIDWWKICHPGVSLDVKAIEFGKKDAPWGARLNDVLSRGAEFKGFDRFNKHPSIKTIVKEAIKEANLNRALTEQEIDQIVEKINEKM